MIDLVENLKLKTQEIIGTGLPDCLPEIWVVDPPDHSNVGDHAIFVGEVDFLRAHYDNTKIRFFDLNNYSQILDDYIQRVPLFFFHGGGNFGDLWPRHQEFRLFIMERFPNIPKIQFPQSIHFQSDGLLERTRSAISSQRDFKLFVRDKKSLEFAKNNFDCESFLCPDMAFSMRDLRRKPSSKYEYFCLLRSDKETLEDKRDELEKLFASSSSSFEIRDWTGNDLSAWGKLDKLMSVAFRKRKQVMPEMLDLAMWIRQKLALQHVARGVNMLCRGKHVVTDRLHGHILSTMLGIPHYVFDSLDGKVSSFHEAWLSDDKTACLISSVEELSEHLSMKNPEKSEVRL